MADFQKTKDAKMHPSVVLASFSSMASNNLYFTMDLWANKLNFTFVDATNRDNMINLKLNMVLDRAEYLCSVLEKIYKDRTEAYLRNEPYMPISMPYRFNCIKAGSKPQPGNEPHILIYTVNIEGVERLCLKGVDNNTEIEIVLGSKHTETNCIDPENILRYLDKTDIVVARLCKALRDLQSNATMYKMLTAFFELFIGPKRRDKQGNVYSQSSNQAPGINSQRTNMGNSSDDVSFN